MDMRIDLREIKGWTAALAKANSRGLPFAHRATLNGMAFKTREIAQETLGSKMILRNPWTARSVAVERAKGFDTSRMSSAVGSTEDYLEKQEFGGVRKRNGRVGVPIPTSYSSGEGENAKPRRRLPRPANTLRRIKLRQGRYKAKNRKQANLVAVKEAAKKGRRHVFLDLGRREGIFRVTGGKRTPQVKMVHDLSRDAVRIPRNPWLAPSVAKLAPFVPGIYRDAVLFQLRRARLVR